MAKKVLLSTAMFLVLIVFSRPPSAAAAGGQVSREVPLSPTPVEPTATQEITLAAGWNLISSYVNPADPDLDVVLAAIAADVVLVKNGNGQVYWPGYGIDEIGAWDVRDGYQVFMQNAAALSISGALVSPAATPIALPAGWSTIAYSRDLTQLASEALDSISSQLLLAKDGDGQVYWPAFAVDQIGTMQPGNGYQVYMDAAGTLLYPDGPATTSPSLIMSGAISVPGEVDSFVFTAQAGDAIIIGATKTSGPLWLDVELTDSFGIDLAGDVASVHAEIIYNITATGEYTISVSHNPGDSTLTYSLFLQKFNNPVGAVDIAYSDNLTGSIVEPAEMDAFTFTAQAGDAIIIGATKTSGPLWLKVVLYDSSANELVGDTASVHGEFTYNVTTTAEYTIFVSHDSGEEALDYNLFLQRFNSPVGAVVIAYSDNLTSSIVEPAEMDSFTFTALAGDAIIIGATKTSGPLWLEVELYDSAANKLDGDTASVHAEIIYNITETAEYTILVSHDSGEDALDYNLFLQRINSPVGAVPIADSETLPGSIVEPAEMDAFTFAATAGELVVIDLTKTSGPLWLKVALYNSSGNELGSDVTSGDGEISYEALETAEYTILVSHDSGESALTYTVSLNLN